MKTAVEISVIVPCYNEEDFLPRTLEALKESLSEIPASSEIIVVDNNCTDASATIARDSGARVVFDPVNQISRARNAGAKAATGKYLVFVDADTVLSPELLWKAYRNLSEGKACGGGGLVRMDKELPAYAQRFEDFWNWLAQKRRLAAGCFIYCLKEAFDAVGGFSESVYASEEIWLSRDLGKWGKKHGLPFMIITEPKILTSTRKLDWFSPGTMLLTTLVLLLFPLAVRYRRLCFLWYKRPNSSGGQ